MTFEVFCVFLKLGLTSFGGPIAHLGYYRSEFVERRRWLDEARYADLIALCQFLPGPTSSQVGFAIGLERAGARGALAAWIGFTAPSALLMVLVATGFAQGAAGSAVFDAIVHALEIVAVAIVAQAVWSMWQMLCPDWPRRVFAMGTAAFVLSWPATGAQWLALAACALLGWRVLRAAGRTGADSGAHSLPEPSAAAVQGASRAGQRVGTALDTRIGVATGWLALAVFLGLLAGLPIVSRLSGSQALQVFDAFYQAGALVFGGGHVVLPLLEAAVVAPGWVSESVFLAGYGAAQALPGPLFSFAAYLGYGIGAGDPASGIAGAADGTIGGWWGAAVGLVALFLPGFLILLAALPFWVRLRRHGALRAAITGVNAGVVGLLLAALIDPLARSAIHGAVDAAIAVLLLALLAKLRWQPLAVVATGIVVGMLRWSVAG